MGGKLPPPFPGEERGGPSAHAERTLGGMSAPYPRGAGENARPRLPMEPRAAASCGRTRPPWASVAGGQAPRAVRHSDATVVGDGHAVRGAAARVPPRPRASHGRRGGETLHALVYSWARPRLPLLRGRAGRGRLGPPPRPPGGAGGRASRHGPRADPAHGVDGAAATRRGGAPAWPLLPQGSPGPQTGPGAMGAERRLPGRPDVEATALGPPGAGGRTGAASGGPPGQSSVRRGRCVDHDAGRERRRARQAAVARRHGHRARPGGLRPPAPAAGCGPVGPWRWRQA